MWSWLALFSWEWTSLEHLWSLPSHQRSLPSHSSLSGMEEFRTCWLRLRLLYGPGYSPCLSLLLRINGWMNEKEKKKVPMLGLGLYSLFTCLSFSYVWMISLLLRPLPHLYLSLVTPPGSVLFFLLYGAIVCPYMHAHTHSHPTDFILLRVWAGLEEQNFTVLKAALLPRWAPLMLSTSVLSSLSAGSSLWAQLNQPSLKCYETYL